MAANGKLAVVAVGGNALITDKAHESIPDQYSAAAMVAHQIAELVAQGWRVVLTHGNGPQVGFILRRSELSSNEVIRVPMDYAGADIQGALGYMFDRAFRNEFRRRGIPVTPIALVTQTLVDREDPAFSHPTKPIGAYFDEATAKRIAAEQGWTIREDAGRGWRRVVPSPLPKRIIELEEIRYLADGGRLVIACGGGGIPVIEDAQGDLQGAEAVIDKDYAASLLACSLGADLLLVSTGVEKMALYYNTPAQRWIDSISLADLNAHYQSNQFDPGSMGPKVKAVIDFLEGGGRSALITNPSNIERALAGATGTHIHP